MAPIAHDDPESTRPMLRRLSFSRFWLVANPFPWRVFHNNDAASVSESNPSASEIVGGPSDGKIWLYDYEWELKTLEDDPRPRWIKQWTRSER
jgi:hypothetical protein